MRRSIIVIVLLLIIISIWWSTLPRGVKEDIIPGVEMLKVCQIKLVGSLTTETCVDNKNLSERKHEVVYYEKAYSAERLLATYVEKKNDYYVVRLYRMETGSWSLIEKRAVPLDRLLRERVPLFEPDSPFGKEYFVFFASLGYRENGIKIPDFLSTAIFE